MFDEIRNPTAAGDALLCQVEARETKERRKVKRSSTRKAEDHVRVKSGARGTQRVEAKLSVKKHRRTNRRLVNMQV